MRAIFNEKKREQKKKEEEIKKRQDKQNFHQTVILCVRDHRSGIKAMSELYMSEVMCCVRLGPVEIEITLVRSLKNLLCLHFIALFVSFFFIIIIHLLCKCCLIFVVEC